MKKQLAILLCIIQIITASSLCFAEDTSEYMEVMRDTSDFICANVTEPVVSAVGGEWSVTGLARSGICTDKDYFARYYANLEGFLNKRQGILHDKKYTEYSRVVIALTAIGKNPENVSGYNLLLPLADFERVTFQGINGAVWALIALDCGSYDIPRNTEASIQATREMYVNTILDKQLPDGGWSMVKDAAASDPDITGMALQALANYRDKAEVSGAIEKALGFLSDVQTSDGGFISSGASGVESCVQVITALCELGIPIEDERFVKNKNTALSCLLGYYEKGKGFKHTLSDTEYNIMSTEQALYGIAAIIRSKESRNSLYNMSDAVDLTKGANLKSDIHYDVNIPQILFPERTFSDIKGHRGQHAVENLAARGIVNGKSRDTFDPDNTVTRAEFSTILVRALGLGENSNSVFNDVEKEAWYHNYVNTAHAYGIINGTGEATFNPEGKITRQEAAVMISGAAILCGMKVKNDITFSKDVLCQFTDYVKAAEWAMPSLAFCYSEGILPDDVMDIKPSEKVTRAEICMMLTNMLLSADLF